MKKTDIHIIGGGVIGLCAAYYLEKAGFSVTVVEKDDFKDGCSYGNAGMIVPSHFVPLATPGVIAKGLSWMFSASSPFYIRPRLNLSLLQWLWRFYRASNARQAAAAMPILRDFNQKSKQLYRDLADDLPYPFGYEEKGLLLLCSTEKSLSEEKIILEKSNNLGVSAQLLRGSQLAELENGTALSVAGAIYYPGDAHLYPNQLMSALKTHLDQQGVQFLSGAAVIGLRQKGDQISHLQFAEGREISVNRVVLATGAWTSRFSKMLGINLLMQDGKGYSFTLNNLRERPGIPSILVEDKVAITPMGPDLRIGGTLEISGMRNHVDARRLAGIVQAIPKYYPNIRPSMPEMSQVWSGFRPCTPDGMPFLGRSQKFSNLIIASGHAMMGLSLGPATGKLVAEIAGGSTPFIPLELFRPDRFS